jgi:hypothetical protein
MIAFSRSGQRSQGESHDLTCRVTDFGLFIDRHPRISLMPLGRNDLWSGVGGQPFC